MKYTSVYSDQEGISHFKDITVDFNKANLPHAPTTEVTNIIATTQLFFAKIPSGNVDELSYGR